METVLAIGVVTLLILYISGVQFLRRKRFARWWMLGADAALRGEWPAAERAYRRCVKLLPVIGPAHRLLGRVLAKQGNLKEAEEHLRLGAALEPRNADGHLDLGLFLAVYAPERVDDAITALESAVSSAPQVRRFLKMDPRLIKLRGHARFESLVNQKEV